MQLILKHFVYGCEYFRLNIIHPAVSPIIIHLFENISQH